MDRRNVLAGVNLNALVVLEAVLRQRSATRAAAELGVTPSAISHTLRDLRALFADELLVRSGRGLTPTPFARDLHSNLAITLSHVEALFDRQEAFDPQTSTKRCVIGCYDESGTTLLPACMAYFAAHAPNMNFEIRTRHGPARHHLESGAFDLELGPKVTVPAFAGGVDISKEQMCCVVRSGHPYTDGTLTMEAYSELPHIRVSPDGFGKSLVDSFLERHGVERRVWLHCYSFLMAPEFLLQTDALLTLPRSLADVLVARGGVRICEPPAALPGFTLQLVWHRSKDDAALQWIRAQIQRVVRQVREDKTS